VLWATLGFKKAFKVCLKYPALVLTPCFGSWTFGPAVQINAKNCCTLSAHQSSKIRVSYFHTWVNYGISLIGVIVTVLVTENGRLGQSKDSWETISVVLSFFLTIVILPTSIGFLQAVDNCCNSFCKCYPSKCFPVVQNSELDVDNMD
jgi:cytochrome bd-type quinol oxidase subunit 2